MNDEALTRYTTAKGYVESIKLILTSPHYKGGHVLFALRPTQLLAGFAIELYLKAWLLADDLDSSVVQKLGHRLDDQLIEAFERGFPDNNNVKLLVERVAGPHGNHVYRYTQENSEIEVLNWNYVLSILDELDVIVDTRVGASESKGLQPSRSFFPTDGIMLATDAGIRRWREKSTTEQ